VLAATVRTTRDLDLAEECVQEAYAKAMTDWARSGVPSRPGAWLTTVARRCAIDRLRRESTLKRFLPLLVESASHEAPAVGSDAESHGYPDDRLRLICTCCHPALDGQAQIALTLRLVCGLTTAEVAKAFLVSESTMAARITRAKKKIAAAGIPYRIPSPAELPARIEAVTAVVHLLFTIGHAAPSGADLIRRDLTERALDLARMLAGLLPQNQDVAGLLGLILLTDARNAARTADDGRLVLLGDQDRSLWDRAKIAEGLPLVRSALRQRPPGRYALQAAIAAVHAEAASFGETDWAEIVGLYSLLLQRWPSPVVALNLATAIGFASGPAAGLAQLDRLGAEPQLASYSYLPAARAHFLAELGRSDEARAAYAEAIMLTENAVERALLESRLAAVQQP
jgi:RNA polymerase sigma factor (sigma-70 family)